MQLTSLLVTTAALDDKLQDVYDEVLGRNPGEIEFHQAVYEILTSLGPVVAKHTRTPP